MSEREVFDRIDIPSDPPVRAVDPDLTCVRCGFPVPARPAGCMHPCRHCGFVYPLGDCSD